MTYDITILKDLNCIIRALLIANVHNNLLYIHCIIRSIIILSPTVLWAVHNYTPGIIQCLKAVSCGDDRVCAMYTMYKLAPTCQQEPIIL